MSIVVPGEPVRGSFERQPLPDMLPASFREIHKLRSGNALKLTQPYDFSGRLERFTQNAGLTRHRHAATSVPDPR